MTEASSPLHHEVVSISQPNLCHQTSTQPKPRRDGRSFMRCFRPDFCLRTLQDKLDRADKLMTQLVRLQSPATSFLPRVVHISFHARKFASTCAERMQTDLSQKLFRVNHPSFSRRCLAPGTGFQQKGRFRHQVWLSSSTITSFGSKLPLVRLQRHPGPRRDRCRDTNPPQQQRGCRLETTHSEFSCPTCVMLTL